MKLLLFEAILGLAVNCVASTGAVAALAYPHWGLFPAESDQVQFQVLSDDVLAAEMLQIRVLFHA